ncbi:MAG: Smr/MutS family protein [Alphaproteobacteria bacterium]|nr:Smr/MutS family protein [Alphaproteobacteria bacterium]
MPVSKDDSDFWLETVKDVKKSRDNTVPTVLKAKKIPQIKEHKAYATKQDFSDYSKALEDAEFGGIDNATLKKFKKEEFKIEGVLDLHGSTEKAAFEQVEDFIVRSYNQNKRCVVIVTGKGLRVNEEDIFAERGVLHKQVPQWLNLPHLRALILIYKHPSERLGGEGALYILLRRNKDI